MIGGYVEILQMFFMLCMHTKFPATVMVLEAVSNEGIVMTTHIFRQGILVNAATYIEVLEAV